MSDRPVIYDPPLPQTRTAYSPRLRVQGGLAPGRGDLVTLSENSIQYVHDNPYNPANDDNLTYIIITPPIHGVMLRDGVPVTQFSHKEMNEGRIAYQHDGSTALTDNFQMWATVTELPGIIDPYAMNFANWYNTYNNTTQGAVYTQVLLRGTASTEPSLTYGASDFHEYHRGSALFNFYTDSPNQAVFVLCYSQACTHTTSAVLAPVYRDPIPVKTITSIGVPGGFTRISSGMFHTINFDTIHQFYNYTTVFVEVFWGAAPLTVLSTPLTVTWNPINESFDECGACLTSYKDLENVYQPWGTDPAIDTAVATDLPGSLNGASSSLHPTKVLPIAFEVSIGDYDGSQPPSAHRAYAPKAYEWAVGGSGSGGTLGVFLMITMQHSAYTYFTFNIGINQIALGIDDVVVTDGPPRVHIIIEPPELMWADGVAMGLSDIACLCAACEDDCLPAAREFSCLPPGRRKC